MLQKFKITSCAFILVLFGFSLMTVSPVLAGDIDSQEEAGRAYTVCANMSELDGNLLGLGAKERCLEDLYRSWLEVVAYPTIEDEEIWFQNIIYLQLIAYHKQKFDAERQSQEKDAMILDLYDRLDEAEEVLTSERADRAQKVRTEVKGVVSANVEAAMALLQSQLATAIRAATGGD